MKKQPIDETAVYRAIKQFLPAGLKPRESRLTFIFTHYIAPAMEAHGGSARAALDAIDTPQNRAENAGGYFAAIRAGLVEISQQQIRLGRVWIKSRKEKPDCFRCGGDGLDPDDAWAYCRECDPHGWGNGGKAA